MASHTAKEDTPSLFVFHHDMHEREIDARVAASQSASQFVTRIDSECLQVVSDTPSDERVGMSFWCFLSETRASELMHILGYKVRGDVSEFIGGFCFDVDNILVWSANRESLASDHFHKEKERCDYTVFYSSSSLHHPFRREFACPPGFRATEQDCLQSGPLLMFRWKVSKDMSHRKLLRLHGREGEKGADSLPAFRYHMTERIRTLRLLN